MKKERGNRVFAISVRRPDDERLYKPIMMLTFTRHNRECAIGMRKRILEIKHGLEQQRRESDRVEISIPVFGNADMRLVDGSALHMSSPTRDILVDLKTYFGWREVDLGGVTNFELMSLRIDISEAIMEVYSLTGLKWVTLYATGLENYRTAEISWTDLLGPDTGGE